MDIEKTWQDADAGVSLSRSEIAESLKHRPESVLHKLRNQLLIKLCFTVLFTVLYILIVVFYSDVLVRVLLGVLILSHLLGIWYFGYQWLKLRKEVSMDRPILKVLKEYQKIITVSLRNEYLMGLFLYPIAASAGFFLSLTQELDWQEITETRWIWIVWLISIIVLTPLSHVLAKWMNKVSFGKYLNKLEGHIHDLEQTDEGAEDLEKAG